MRHAEEFDVTRFSDVIKRTLVGVGERLYAMAIMTKEQCPLDIQKLWEAAEAIGFSNFIYIEKAKMLMADLPNATIEDDRVPVSWDMYELKQGIKPKIITISVAYRSSGSEYVFISGDSFLVHSQDELKEVCDRLSERFIEDGFEIQNTLFVEISDAMILAAAKELQEGR